MSLEVTHKGGDGTTVPYGPVRDNIRNNRGFVDARRRPDIAANIAEGSESLALKKLLMRIAEENKYFSLGCDLGMHPEPEEKVALRQVAGGYIQLVGIGYAGLSTSHYDEFNLRIERGLRAKSQGKSWRLWLEGRYVNFKFENEPAVQAPSIWIWFFARSKTEDRARQDREELINTLSEVLHSHRVVQTLNSEV